MITKYETVGITYDESKLKLAALLFDKIYCPIKSVSIPKNFTIPFDIREDVLNYVSAFLSSDEDALGLIMQKTLNNSIDGNLIINKSALIDLMSETRMETKTQFFNTLILQVSNKITNQNVLGVPIFNKSILKYNFDKSDIYQKVEVEIINAPIIDCSGIEWNQIVEAKKDKEFNNKVKRFSIFINKNYEGKSLSYVTDDLNQQLEDYKNICKKHGIKLSYETIKSLSNSKSLFGTFALSILSLIANMPQYAIISGAIGGALELVNFSINLKLFNDQYQSSIKNCPIALIYDIEKMIQKDKKS